MSAVEKSFSSAAVNYDKAARVQPIVADVLVKKLNGLPSRILEVGCGTGGLSVHLVKKFQGSEIVLSDISIEMLSVCRHRIGGRAEFRQMDGEFPDRSLGRFDLIVSSLCMQWFGDLSAAVGRLVEMLRPGGRLVFSTLGKRNFKEWKILSEQFGFCSGLHHYPDPDDFPWPSGGQGEFEEMFLKEHHASGAAFLKSLKLIGAATPRADYKPITSSVMKNLLKVTENGFSVTYHVLYGDFRVD